MILLLGIFLLFLYSHVNTSLLYKIVITVKLSLFDNASSKAYL